MPQFRDLRGTPDGEAARLQYWVALELPRSAVSLGDVALGVRGIQDAAGEIHDSGAGADRLLLALGAAELYFRRPDARADGREELPSLFSPYWQARLTSRPAGGLRLISGTTR